jgi:hypothetical protein
MFAVGMGIGLHDSILGPGPVASRPILETISQFIFT